MVTPNDSQHSVMDIGGSAQIQCDLAKYIGKKGLRFHDRSSKLTMTAVQILLNETKLLDRYPSHEVNLVVGSDGALQSQDEVVREAVFTPKLMNPKAYPNRGCNVIAGQVSLMFNFLGESTVISSGYRSGIDALIYAVRKVLVSSKNSPYVVAVGEGLSEARAWRRKHKTRSGTQYLSPIEGAVALSVEKGNCFSAPTEDIYQVVGYQQARQETSSEVHIQEFIASLGYDIQEIDVMIIALEDVIQVWNKMTSQIVPYDVFGATTLLKLSEIIGLDNYVYSQDLPKTIAIYQSDQSSNASMILLRRK
ncbi:MAG: hypothetical protein HC769_21275 [Cyanobacteria bacterium CRU_2_1]|nr:hypothetical protein [Cyanobacteria bacterium CRU_2_1]